MTRKIPFICTFLLWAEAHTKRQATQHSCLPSLLGEGDKGIEIVRKKYFALGVLDQQRQNKNLMYQHDKPSFSLSSMFYKPRVIRKASLALSLSLTNAFDCSDLSQTGIFHWFSQYIVNLTRRQFYRDGQRGAQRSVLRVNVPKTHVAQRTGAWRGHNLLVNQEKIFVVKYRLDA
jgi:hypothetical protein